MNSTIYSDPEVCGLFYGTAPKFFLSENEERLDQDVR